MLEEKMIMKSGMMKQILAVTLAALTEVSGVTAMLPAVAVYAEEATTEADAEKLEEAAGEAADAEETETEQTPEIELEVGDATVVLKNETGADVTVEFVEEDAEAETEEAEDAETETETEDIEAEAAPGYLVLTDEDGEQHIFEDVDLLAVTDLVLTVEDSIFYLNYLDENMEECRVAESLDEADAEQSAADAAAAAAEAAVRAAAEAAASGGDGERTEVSRQKYDDCDGSGHGYYEITYSDGSTKIEEY